MRLRQRWTYYYDGEYNGYGRRLHYDCDVIAGQFIITNIANANARAAMIIAAIKNNNFYALI